jgi:hypothetical protein
MDPLTLIALAALGAAGALDAAGNKSRPHVICAWCKDVIQQGTDTRPESTSHGMCASCSEETEAKLDEIDASE